MGYGIWQVALDVDSTVTNTRVDRAIRYLSLKKKHGDVVGVLYDWKSDDVKGLFRADKRYCKGGTIHFRPEEGHAYLQSIELEIHDHPLSSHDKKVSRIFYQVLALITYQPNSTSR